MLISVNVGPEVSVSTSLLSEVLGLDPACEKDAAGLRTCTCVRTGSDSLSGNLSQSAQVKLCSILPCILGLNLRSLDPIQNKSVIRARVLAY